MVRQSQVARQHDYSYLRTSSQVHEFARQFCPPNRASKAVGRIKRSVQSGAEVPFELRQALCVSRHRALKKYTVDTANRTAATAATVATPPTEPQ